MSSDGSSASASQATLARASGQGSRTVRKHLSAAVEEGWLERTRRGHRQGDGLGVSSVYRASLPARMCLLRDESTGTPEPVETPLNRNMEAPKPARGVTPTGPGVPTPEGFTNSLLQECVAALAFSNLKEPP